MAITEGKWRAVRVAVRETGDRFADLVSACAPSAMATADWSVADTVAHVGAIASLYVSLVQPEQFPHPFPALRDRIAATTVDTVAELNELLLRLDPERDQKALTRRLRADIDRLLAATEHRDPAATVPWLGDSRVPLAGIAAHLVNELLIHGRDIARGTRHQRWAIPPQDAALFFDLFLVEVIRCGYGRLLDDGDRPQAHVAVEFRSRYTSPVTLSLRDGHVSIADRRSGPDVHLRFDPTTLNLMLFGRISRARAALTGKVVIWGRRPWLLPAFLRTVRLPS